MQARPVYGPHHPDHQIDRREFMSGCSETVPDDSLYPVPRAGPSDGLFADDQAQTSVLHSIENQVQT